jgi:hypothetical protein
MVLLNQVIQIFNLPQFGLYWQQFLILQVLHGWRVGGILINIDNSGNLYMLAAENFLQESLS